MCNFNFIRLLPLLISLMSLTSSLASILKEGECLSRPDSKRYHIVDFNAPYPKTTSFTCIYDCNVNGDEIAISGLSKVVTYNMQGDAKLVVCQGVKVVKVSYGYEFDSNEKFFIHDTNIKELKEVARSSVELFSSTSLPYIKRLIRNLEIVIPSYKVAGANSIEFKEASAILEGLLISLRNNKLGQLKQLLDETVKRHYRGISHFSAQQIIDGFLKSECAWALPIL